MEGTDFTGRLRGGEPLVGAWSMTANPVVLEVLAQQSLDFVVLDGEHSENTIADLAAGVRAVESAGSGTAPVIRVSGLDRAEIRRVLDFGPGGIIVPQIESVTEAEAAVSATRYPPDGVRGVAGGRASKYGAEIEEYVESADDRTATLLQVETEGAVDSIEEIAALEGLDGLFIGPADLSARLDCFARFEEPAFQRAVEAVVSPADDADVPVGTLATTPENVETRWTEWGMDFLVAGTDVAYLREGLDRFSAQVPPGR